MTALDAPARPRALARWTRGLADLVVGALLCTGPVLSLVALGWLTRRMHAHIAGAPRPGWLLGEPGTRGLRRMAGGLAANIRAGLVTALGLAALTLPFSALWLFAWWAGWENSFNKGYEQAWVGPVTGLAASLLACVVLTYLPAALAHHAAEGRLSAFFEWRRIRGLAGAAGWRLPGLALLSVILAVPLFAARGLPVFVEEIVPGFAAAGPEERDSIAGILSLVTAAYAFAALLFLRVRAARIHVVASGRPGRLGLVWVALAAILWFGLVALVFVGQFLNHAWPLWLTHPFFLLPWPG